MVCSRGWVGGPTPFHGDTIGALSIYNGTSIGQRPHKARSAKGFDRINFCRSWAHAFFSNNLGVVGDDRNFYHPCQRAGDTRASLCPQGDGANRPAVPLHRDCVRHSSAAIEYRAITTYCPGKGCTAIGGSIGHRFSRTNGRYTFECGSLSIEYFYGQGSRVGTLALASGNEQDRMGARYQVSMLWIFKGRAAKVVPKKPFIGIRATSGEILEMYRLTQTNLKRAVGYGGGAAGKCGIRCFDDRDTQGILPGTSASAIRKYRNTARARTSPSDGNAGKKRRVVGVDYPANCPRDLPVKSRARTVWVLNRNGIGYCSAWTSFFTIVANAGAVKITGRRITRLDV